MPDDRSTAAADRWIVVEDSPFLPARGGGEREHLGILRAALDAGLVALVVLPVPGPLDEAPYRELLGDVPLITVPRRENPLLLADPRQPYVVGSRPAPRDLVARARRLAPGATGVLLSSYKSRLIGQRLAEGLGLPLVLRMHNLEGPYHRALADGTPGPRGWALRWDARRITRDEASLGRRPWLTGVADISAADAAWRRAHSSCPVVHVPPFALDARGPEEPRRPGAVPSVLFVGTFDVATNVDSVRWLLEHVWPRVRAARPDARLDLVGRAPSPALRQEVEGAVGVALHGDVPSVAPYLAGAHVAVNPAVSGSGVNIKLVDYLAAGVPVVSTSHATAGLDLAVGDDLLVADDPAAFAEAVVSLLDEPERAERIGAHGRASVQRMLDPATNVERLRALMHGRTG